MTASARPVPPGYLLWLAAGFIVWWSALAILYAVQAIGCAFAVSVGPLRLVLVFLLFAHLAVIGWMWRRLARADLGPDFGRTGAFLSRAAIWSTIAAFVTTVFTLSATMMLTLCR